MSAETEDIQFGLAHSIVETLPIINKPEHTKKKGGIQGKNEKTLVQEDKRTMKEGGPHKEHQLPKPPPITRSLSNKKREDLLKGCIA